MHKNILVVFTQLLHKCTHVGKYTLAHRLVANNVYCIFRYLVVLVNPDTFLLSNQTFSKLINMSLYNCNFTQHSIFLLIAGWRIVPFGAFVSHLEQRT